MSDRREKALHDMGPRALAAPRWWPTWFGIGLLWCLNRLPLGCQRALGRTVGRTLYTVSPERRRITRINFRLCFPEFDPRERERLVRAHFALLGESIFEMAYGWWRSSEKLARLGTIVGREHLDAALARGKGVILLQGHFVATDIAGQLFCMQYDVTTTYAPPKNAVARYLITRLRGRFIRRQIHHADVRRIVRALADGEIVWHAPDQGARKDAGVEATFFGQPARTHTATAKLARISGAAVVPYHPVRLPDGRFELRIEPALEDFPGSDITAATQRINDILERQVRVAPAQYLWSHRRFKPARKSEPSPYR